MVQRISIRRTLGYLAEVLLVLHLERALLRAYSASTHLMARRAMLGVDNRYISAPSRRNPHVFAGVCMRRLRD